MIKNLSKYFIILLPLRLQSLKSFMYNVNLHHARKAGISLEFFLNLVVNKSDLKMKMSTCPLVTLFIIASVMNENKKKKHIYSIISIDYIL